MWPCEVRFRALSSISDLFVLSSMSGDSITIPSTTAITMVEPESDTTYGELVATLKIPGTTDLFRTSSGAEYYLKSDITGVYQISKDNTRIRKVTRIEKVDESESKAAKKAKLTHDLNTVSGVITDTGTYGHPFVCVRVDKIHGTVCDESELFIKAQNFCKEHKNPTIRKIAARMKKPRAWTFSFKDGELVGPHISLNTSHMKDCGKRVEVTMKHLKAWEDVHSYFCAIALDPNAQSDGKKFVLKSAWGSDLHLTCAQHIKY